MSQYYSIITNNGLLKEAAASTSGGAKVSLTHIAIGDANGTSYDPSGTQTALVHEVYRTALSSVVVDKDNPNQLIVEGVINEEIGSFYIREVGVFASDGTLFAIGKYPETYKPALPNGSGKRLYIRMILGFTNSPQVNLIISTDINNDPNFSITVNNALASKLAKAENLADLSNVERARSNLGLGIGALANAASETAKGITSIASQVEVDAGFDDAKIVTPLKLKNNITTINNTNSKRIFIRSATGSDTHYISFTNLSPEFKKYEVEFIDVKPSSGDAGLACQVSVDNVYTALRSYISGNIRSSTSKAVSSMTNHPSRLTLIGHDTDPSYAIANGSDRGLHGTFELFDPGNPTTYKIAKWNTTYVNSTYVSEQSFVVCRSEGYGIIPNTTKPITAIYFFMTSANIEGNNGTIVKGTFNLYGIR